MQTIRVALSATALTAAALVPLTGSGVAGATGPTLTRASVVYVADLDGDFNYGIYGASASSPNTRTPILAETASRDVIDAKVSPDGTKVAATVDEGLTGDYSLDVIDVATQAVTHTIVPISSTATTSDEIAGFDWSKDGLTLVFGQVHMDFNAHTTTYGLFTRLADGSSSSSTAVSGGTGMVGPSYSPDGSKLAAIKASDMTLHVLDPAGPTDTTIGTAPSGNFFGPTSWSPDGTKVATSHEAASSTPHADLVLYSATGASDQTPTTIAAGGTHIVNDQAAFAADGSLWFDRWDGSDTASGNGDLMQAQLGHSGWVVSDRTNTAAIDESSPAFARPTDDGAPASPVTFNAFGLNGTSVVVRWTVPAGLTDYSHVVLHRTQPPDTTVTDIDNAIGTSYTDTGLTVGNTYSYTATIVDGAGNSGPVTPSDHLVTATNPAKIVASSPSSNVTPYAAFRFSWGVANPAGTTYDVDYAVKGGSTWTLGTSTHLAQNTTATSGVINGVLGQTYYIRAAVKDTHGNSTITPWSAVNVPYDQKNGQFSTGWVTASNRNFWIGTIAYTAKNGAVFVISPTAKSFSIIGTKCPGCGKFAVYIDGHYRGTISTVYSKTTLLRKVLATYNFTTIAKHQIKLVAVLGTNQRLNIDGVGDLR